MFDLYIKKMWKEVAVVFVLAAVQCAEGIGSSTRCDKTHFDQRGIGL